MEETPDWARRRRAELAAKAPKKAPKKARRALVDLDRAAKAAKATNCHKLFVWLWLQHRAWLLQSQTVKVSNEDLAKYGIGRNAKARALRQFEAAGLITVDWTVRKSPVVTSL